MNHLAKSWRTIDEDRKAVEGHLRSVGIDHLYGGGPDKKGHGFWLSYKGQTIHNDGIASGNPCFWMADEAAEFARLADVAGIECERNYDEGLDSFLSTPRPYPDRRLTGETASNEQDNRCQTFGWSCLAHSTMTLNLGRVVDVVRSHIDIWADIDGDYATAIY